MFIPCTKYSPRFCNSYGLNLDMPDLSLLFPLYAASFTSNKTSNFSTNALSFLAVFSPIPVRFKNKDLDVEFNIIL